MRIAVLELMPKGHFTLVESLVAVFNSDSSNQIDVYITNSSFNNIIVEQSLNVNYFVAGNDLSIELKNISRLNYDILIVSSLDSFLKEFAVSDIYKNRVFLVVHNIDFWFDLKLIKRIKSVILGVVKNYKSLAYLIKQNFTYNRYKHQIINQIDSNNGGFIVLNANLKNNLRMFVEESKIRVIPFSVYRDKPIYGKQLNTEMILIIIPGMVSQVRRDYDSLLSLIERLYDNHNTNIHWEFLGGVAENEGGREIISRANKLIEKGIPLKVYDKNVVSLGDFDDRMKNADFVLGNLHVSINSRSIYGKTKDSGTIYTMIKYAKPGILPSSYPNIHQLESSTLTFSDYEDLFKLLVNLNFEFINLLNYNAKLNSELFTPQKVYKQFIEK
jgi:hypothetical protein